MAPQNLTSDKPKQSTERFERFADDATGINVPDRKPIDNRMPSMPPA